MTIRETLKIRSKGKVCDRHLMANKYLACVRNDGRYVAFYTDLHLGTNDAGETTIYGTDRGNENVMVCDSCFINPDEEYCPYTGIWIGGYEYLYLKK